LSGRRIKFGTNFILLHPDIFYLLNIEQYKMSRAARTAAVATVVAKKSLFQQALDYMSRHRAFLVSLLLICVGFCLLIWQSTLTKHHYQGSSTPATTTPASNGKNNDDLDVQHHVDFPDSHVNDQAHSRLARHPNTTHDSCRQLCDMTDWCHFWEHQSSDNSCTLYQAISQGSDYRAAIEPHAGSHVGVFTRKLTE